MQNPHPMTSQAKSGLVVSPPVANDGSNLDRVLIVTAGMVMWGVPTRYDSDVITPLFFQFGT